MREGAASGTWPQRHGGSCINLSNVDGRAFSFWPLLLNFSVSMWSAYSCCCPDSLQGLSLLLLPYAPDVSAMVNLPSLPWWMTLLLQAPCLQEALSLPFHQADLMIAEPAITPISNEVMPTCLCLASQHLLVLPLPLCCLIISHGSLPWLLCSAQSCLRLLSLKHVSLILPSAPGSEVPVLVLFQTTDSFL